MINALRFIAKSIPAIAILLIVIQLIWSNTLVGSGRFVTSVDLQIAAIRQQNGLLEQEVASASSLMTIVTRAQEMGFIEPKSDQFVMIDGQTPVAFSRPQ